MAGQVKKTICVVGAGQWGRNHIRTLHEMGNLGGIVENDSNNLAEIAKMYPLVKKYTSIESALEDGYDGYIVATPAETHFQIGSFLLKLGQNVLIEKPMTLNSIDSENLVRISQESGSRLMVGHILLFHPAVRKIKEVIDKGIIGDVLYIYSNRLNLGKIRTRENVFWSFAPHDISVCNYLTGKQPVSVNAFGASFVRSGIHDTVTASLIYPDNINAHIFVSWLHPFKEQRLVVTGSKGMLVFEDSSPDKQVVFYDQSVDWIENEPVARKGCDEIVQYENSSPLENELKYFIQHLDSDICIADGKCGHEVVEILEKVSTCLHQWR